MSEQDLLVIIVVFFVGVLLGVIATLITNKVRSGSASPTKIKQEMEEYQDKVEAHFEETSKRFKMMSTQYQELYQHLSVGATSLCRPENIAPGLVSGASPLEPTSALENKADKKVVLADDKKDSSTVSDKTAVVSDQAKESGSVAQDKPKKMPESANATEKNAVNQKAAKTVKQAASDASKKTVKKTT